MKRRTGLRREEWDWVGKSDEWRIGMKVEEEMRTRREEWEWGDRNGDE